MEPAQALARLQSPDSGRAAALARVTVEHALRRPVSEMLTPRQVARQIVMVLEIVSRDRSVRDRVVEAVEEARQELGKVEEPPRTWLPEEIEPALRELAGHEWTPGEDLTFRIINHPALRSLVRDVLQDAFASLVSRVQNVDSGMLGGLGGRAVKRGRGLLGNMAGAAESLVGSLGQQLEQLLETRVKETLGQATEEAVRSIARWIADPRHASTLAGMRVSALEALLDTPTSTLLAEVDTLDAGEIADIALAGARALATRDTLEDEITDVVGQVMARTGDDTLGDWLDTLEARETWVDATLPTVERIVHDLVASEEFSAWWSTLFD